MSQQKTYWASNVAFLRARKKMTQETLATILGINRTKLKSHETGDTKNPTVEDLLNFSAYFKISIDNLLKTDLSKMGELKLRELEAGDMSGANLRVLAITVDKANNENVEYIPVKAKAGYTSGGYNDPEFISTLPKFSFPDLPRSNTYRLFPTTGDSMLPIPENSRVLAQYIADWKTIKPDTLCIVLLKGQDFVFKSVTVGDDGSILLKSLNKFYEPYTVQANDVSEIWKYKEYHTNTLPAPDTDMQQLLKSMDEIKQQVNLLASK